MLEKAKGRIDGASASLKNGGKGGKRDEIGKKREEGRERRQELSL
jgi:hypothetical protein